ncbi:MULTISPECIES: LacI family DNA-binding transcriptional regulator [unclassified Microbacterium]|uniref:LacI family DNA-binding transcriptional regulator n=1 Tax=unclassified Microbacterium TaxID=2609290 RepID=UPI000EA8A01B|nr:MULTISPECIES: LacI family DNA-binding transcriptional regulator [unclassified Microbacterium]MBT2483684.1 LacI family DNA-binding transcriptional regulator [Microbacterium sp. ISL-108]RKN66683.1 LacI family transcriptional regulator [Microbacterium sp. CGR2]
MPASVKDVAALAGVSSSTVSNYLNHPHVLGAASRERVRAAIEQLGYVPNESARQLRAGSSKALALILLDAWLPYFNELSRGVDDVAREGGWSLFFSNSNRDSAQESRNIDMFEAHRVQGIVIYPLGDVVPRLEQLAQRGIRSVVVGPIRDSPTVASVLFDDRGGGRLAGEHLLSLGRRRILFLGSAAVDQSNDRLAGIQDAVADTDATITVTDVAHLATEDGLRAAEQIIALPEAERPDAVFAANDLVALGVLTQLLRHGIRVPEEIALVGFDDVDQAHQGVVPLTSVRQPGYAIGRAAGAALLQQLADPTGPPPATTPFPAELIVRESTVGR